MKSARLEIEKQVNPEGFLNRIARAIESRIRGPGIKSYVIGWGAGGVGCRPAIHNERHPLNSVWGHYSDKHLERGLTNDQWDELKRQVCIFLKIGRHDQ